MLLLSIKLIFILLDMNLFKFFMKALLRLLLLQFLRWFLVQFFANRRKHVNMSHECSDVSALIYSEDYYWSIYLHPLEIAAKIASVNHQSYNDNKLY